MKRNIFNFLLLVFCFGSISAQTNIYVSAFTGIDTQNGTSWQNAFKSLDKALNQIGTQQGEFNIYLSQGSYSFNGNQGSNGSENQFGSGQSVSILGGYSTPLSNGTEPFFNADIYNVAINTQSETNSSAFRLLQNSNASLTIKDVTIINSRQGNDSNGSLVTFDGSNGATLNLENVNVNEWRGGDAGLVYVFDTRDSKININNSLFERTANSRGDGQLVRINDGNRNVDVVMDSTVVRNIRGVGLDASIFYIDLSCSRDRGESSLIISNSEFNNIKRGRAAGQAAAVITAKRLPLLHLTNNKFQGNTGGNGGAIQFDESGEFISEGNLYQDNFGGQSGGAVWIRDSYPCTTTQTTNPVSNIVTFNNDKFMSNRSGIDGLSGRGGAIHIANDLIGNFSTNKPVTISNSQFFDNKTSAYDGGAIFANTSESLVINNSVFCNNKANAFYIAQVDGDGGAVYAEGSGNLTISNSTFIDNRSEARGGAVSSNLEGPVRINQCSYFSGNSAENEGGALSANNYSSLIIDRATFDDNVSENLSGGALFFSQSNNVVPVVKNSTFNRNIADNEGGAIISFAPLNLEDVKFTGNTAQLNGGAVYGSLAITVLKADFSFNLSSARGGAIYSPNGVINVSKGKFNNNSAGTDGGAIYGDRAVNVNNASFIDNTAIQDGGAIGVVTRAQLTYNLVNFINNAAGDQGGAIYLSSAGPSSSDANVILTQAYFEGNTATTEGGALFLSGYGIQTGSPTSAIGNVIFTGNRAGSRGGAIDIYKPGTQNVLLYSGRYINNNGGNDGGAIYFDAVSSFANQYINNNEFVGNEADLTGGAIHVVDRVGNSDVDQLNGNRFWRNTLNGNPNNINNNERSDIYLGFGTRSFNATIGQMNNNYLQFPAVAAPNYLTTGSTGYNLGTGNQKQLTALSQTATSFTTQSTMVEECLPKDCPIKNNTPVSPIVVSATGNINDGNPDSYTSYTKVAVDGNCIPDIAEVAFTARSNRAPNSDDVIITTPTSELNITYLLTITNNLTGASVTSDRLIINANTPNVRVEDPSDEIPDGVTSQLVRDVYKTYYLDVTEEIQPGYSYSYSIVNVEVLASTGTRSFEFTPGQYETDLITEYCPCIIAPNPGTTNIMDSKVGVSTLDRNADNWLKPNNRLGAYIVLESTEKGFVVPRYNTTEEITGNIGTSGVAGIEEGMLVWDNQANCLKMFYDNNGDGTMTWNCISNNSCTN